MRKSYQTLLLLTGFLAAFVSPLTAQNIEQEISDLAQQWQAAYNRADHAALGAMYTDKVISYNEDGSSNTVSKADIEASFANDFKEYSLHTAVTLTRMLAQKGGKVKVFGTYANTGSSKKTGDAISESGKFEHVAVQEGGVWKLCELKVMSAK